MTCSRAAIAAPNPYATQAAAHILTEGGTAVDAAIAAMVTATVTEPGVVSTLGGCYLNIWPAGGDPLVIDGNVEMPGREGTAERFGSGLIEAASDYGGGMITYIGPGSVATPGMFAGMGWAHERFGRAPWASLMRPAAEIARSGFALGRTAQSYLVLVNETILAWDPATQSVLTKDGQAPPIGHLMSDENLAQSLEQIAAEGYQSLYSGDLARIIAADMQVRGGLLSAADLAAYRPVVRHALRSRLGSWELACNPPPSIGGPVLTAMLRLLSKIQDPDPADIAGCLASVLDFRLDRMDGAQDLAAAGAELLESLSELGADALPTSPSTAHVSVVDSVGMACALTASAGYGSGMTITGTGLIANNALGELELNRRGLHTLPPGTRLASNMAPTTARRPDGAVLAIGTPGADRITTALAQVLTHFARYGTSLQTAIDRPRLHPHRLADGDTCIEYEQDPVIAADLERAGLRRHEHPPQVMYFGGVGAALRTAGGTLEAAADPRRAAATLVT